MFNSQLTMSRHNILQLNDSLSKLPKTGLLKRNALGLTYLDIDDNYIHQIFPLIKDNEIMKPEYFGDDLVGAHISVIYPSEETLCHAAALNQQHLFSVSGLYSGIIENKKYYFLKV